jgi:hypothetical protein
MSTSELRAPVPGAEGACRGPGVAQARRARPRGGWSYERFAQALLETEHHSREAHGDGRIKAARFPARKTLEEFDFTLQAIGQTTLIQQLGQLDFLAGKENVVLLGPPGTGKTQLSNRARGSAPAWPAIASPSAPPPDGSRSSPTPNAPGAWTTSSPGCSTTRC